MNQRQWWNGRWSRMVRRDVFVRNAADGRWLVELRRGGPEGRLRTRSFESEQAAVEWIEAAVLAVAPEAPGAAGPEDGWREIRDRKPAKRPDKLPAKRDARRAGKVARALSQAG